MPHRLLASSAIAIILALSACSDKKSTETQATTKPASQQPQVEFKFNAAPVANAGSDMIARVGEAVTLNGTQSSDPDHDLMTFTWTQTKGPEVELINADTLTPSFVAPASKEPLAFSLVVSDGQAESEPDMVNVTISNRAPTADAGRTIIATRSSTISLDGGGSIDPDDDSITYKWEQVYGPVVTLNGADTANPSFTMPHHSGYAIFALTVNDGTDESVADTVAVKITNEPPVANVADFTDNVIAGKKVTLDGSASSDPEGDTIAFIWRQTLGTPVMLENANTAKPSFVAPERPDHLIFELTVSDGEFTSHADSVVVSVKNKKPTIEEVPTIEKIAKAKEEEASGLKPVKKELPTLAVADAPKPVEDILSDISKDFKPKTMADDHGGDTKGGHAKGSHDVHWGYEGAGAPENWADLKAEYELCGSGKSQSPINIQTSGLKQDPKPIEFNYSTSALNVVNNGHTIQVNYDEGSHAIIGGKRFELLQFHFHAPSENTIDGKPTDMVAHMVHKSDDGQLAVVAVLFNQGKENQFLKPIWDNLPLESGSKTSSSQTIFASNMLPDDKAYYHFSGSLTTPPCSENVNWNVLASVQEASSAQIEAFKSLFPKSVRPVQPLFGRVVELN